LGNGKHAYLTDTLYREFDDEKGKAVVEASMAAMPDAWKADALSSSLRFNGVSHFHRPGIVYAVDLVVAVPNSK
jgi:hypothetical protein